jgi:D-serine deaminase-like pyridoxal phosphate-dependent protein
MDTPLVVVHYEKMIRNLDRMAAFARAYRVRLRPHGKTHKMPQIAKMQLERGAAGITVAKIGEAEVMAAHGCDDILIAYPLIGNEKVERLLALARTVRVSTLVDSFEGAKALSDAFLRERMRLPVYVKIDSGLHRCGVQPGKEAAQLVRHVVSLPGLQFLGLLTHAGHAYAAKDARDLQRIGQGEADCLIETAEILRKEGIAVQEISVGSTPTVRISGAVTGVTEIRPGNYVFHDMTQVRLGVATEEDCALRVWARVVSRPNKNVLVLDSGAKTLALDRGAHGVEGVSGYGRIVGYPDCVIERLSEEHAVVKVPDDCPLSIGDVVEIIPNHACPVVNLTDQVYVIREGQSAEVWRVEARGKTS